MVVMCPRYFKQHTLLDNFPEADILSKFCLSKDLSWLLFWEIRPFQQFTTLSSYTIPPMTTFLPVLHFLGRTSYLMVEGEVDWVLQLSFCSLLAKALQDLRHIAPKYIYLPNTHQEWQVG